MKEKVSLTCPHCYGQIDVSFSSKKGKTRTLPLSILCVTKGQSWALEFLIRMREAAERLGAEFVVGLDWEPDLDNPDESSLYVQISQIAGRLVFVRSKGYVESVLNRLGRECKGRYVLRLDDDEEISPALFEWLKSGDYKEAGLWAIPTMSLWPDRKTFITSPPLWPDTHLRLTAWNMATSWPDEPHGKPPFVQEAERAPAALYHHKYILKPIEERRELMQKYEEAKPGAGGGRRKVFQVPEDVLPYFILHPVGDGRGDVKTGQGKKVKT